MGMSSCFKLIQPETFMRFISLALLALAPLCAQAAPLAVAESVELAATPAQVWAQVGNFGSLAWHPVVAQTAITQGKNNVPGVLRTVTVKDGAHIVESLASREASQHTLTYRIVSAPLPVVNYESTLSVTPSGTGSRVVWGSTFERAPQAEGVDDTKAQEIIRGIYRAGLDQLVQQFHSAKR
jgi:mxaD protein